MGGPKMSAEVFTQATDALNTAMVAATRRMLDVAPRDAVLVQVAHTLHRSYDAGHLAPIAAAALVRLAEEQAAHEKTRAELSQQTPPSADRVRVTAVVDWRRQRVYGLTNDVAVAQQWTRDLIAKYGDPLAATMTTDVVPLGAQLAGEATP